MKDKFWLKLYGNYLKTLVSDETRSMDKI